MNFPPGNIMRGDGYQDDGVFDWSEKLEGPPDADIAMTSLILPMTENWDLISIGGGITGA